MSILEAPASEAPVTPTISLYLRVPALQRFPKRTEATAATSLSQVGTFSSFHQHRRFFCEGEPAEYVYRLMDGLAPGGVLFGDDWSWDGVRLAVLRFAREVGVTYRFSADKWVLDKPGRTPE